MKTQIVLFQLAGGQLTEIGRFGSSADAHDHVREEKLNNVLLTEVISASPLDDPESDESAAAARLANLEGRGATKRRKGGSES